MTALAIIAAAQLAALTSGQLGKLGDDEPSQPAVEKPAAQVPSPAVEPAKPLPAPPGPLIADRIVCIDGRQYRGRLAGANPSALEIEVEGLRHAVPFSAIAFVERAGVISPAPVHLPEQRNVPHVRERLSLTFDIFQAERDLQKLRYWDKGIFTAAGLAIAAVGLFAVKGDAGRVIGAVGAMEAGVGTIWLSATGLRSYGLSNQIDEARERLGALQAER